MQSKGAKKSKISLKSREIRYRRRNKRLAIPNQRRIIDRKGSNLKQV